MSSLPPSQARQEVSQGGSELSPKGGWNMTYLSRSRVLITLQASPGMQTSTM